MEGSEGSFFIDRHDVRMDRSQGAFLAPPSEPTLRAPTRSRTEPKSYLD